MESCRGWDAKLADHRRAVALLVALLTASAAPHRMVFAGAQAGQSAQTTGLKIVVIAGEDAINIIQQKTAVRPIVEVRDRNDLPVSGVPVTFRIAGQNASFGSGLQTVTVTTNAAGRAAVTSINPLTPGAYQINVTAASQGQVAAATITQTNFATAAAATAAGAAVAAGAGAATGGGLSAVAVTGIVVGAGAAAVVGAKAAGVLGGGDENPACTHSVSPTSLSFSSAGGSAAITVTVTPGDCEFATRAWTATSNAPFIIVNPAGEETASVFVQRQNSGDPPRTGTIIVAGHTITIAQAARCALSVSPASLSFPVSGGSAVVTVTASPAGCDEGAWTASSGASTFVTLSPTSGTGSGTVTVTVPQNTLSGAGLTGALSIAGQIVQFVQAGFNTVAGSDYLDGR